MVQSSSLFEFRRAEVFAIAMLSRSGRPGRAGVAWAPHLVRVRTEEEKVERDGGDQVDDKPAPELYS